MILLIVFLVILIHMSLIWLWYRAINNPAVVDVGWASGLTLSGLIYLSPQPLSLRTVILGLALVLWGARLGGYLWWTRIRKKEVDKRYTALSQSWGYKKPLAFFVNFQLQGLFIFIVSLSWYFIGAHPAPHNLVLDALGLALFISSLTLESLADMQLQQFKKANPGALCTHKLWRISRHPNCFFDWLTWCSFTLFAIPSSWGVLSLISPLALYVIMVYITIPITEKESLKSRGAQYSAYQLSTPKFVPKCPVRN